MKHSDEHGPSSPLPPHCSLILLALFKERKKKKVADADLGLNMRNGVLFMYLFAVFNGAVGISDCVASNGWMKVDSTHAVVNVPVRSAFAPVGIE
jgi:hypothetical protein